MPTYFPRMSAEEINSMVASLRSLKEQSFTPEIVKVLADPAHPDYAQASYTYGYLEAFYDAMAHNPVFTQIELQRIGAHDDARARGYSEGKTEAREMLRSMAPKAFPGYQHSGQPNAEAVLPYGKQ